jgi:hypothetical protein
MNHKMTPAQPVYWGNIEIETAKDATAQLEKGEKKEKKETKDVPFDGIVVASDLRAVKAEVEKVRQVHPSVYEELTCCVENASPGRSSRHGKHGHHMG